MKQGHAGRRNGSRERASDGLRSVARRQRLHGLHEAERQPNDGRKYFRPKRRRRRLRHLRRTPARRFTVLAQRPVAAHSRRRRDRSRARARASCTSDFDTATTRLRARSRSGHERHRPGNAHAKSLPAVACPDRRVDGRPGAGMDRRPSRRQGHDARPRQRKRAGNSGPLFGPARIAGISLPRSRSVRRRHRDRAVRRVPRDCRA